MLTRVECTNEYSWRRNANDTKIGGFALVNYRDEIYVGGVHILEEHRGKGYSNEMMRELIEEAARLSVDKKLYLYVSKYNKVAIHVYEKAGFKITDEYNEGAWEMTRIPNKAA